jgi:hypothetical protein
VERLFTKVPKYFPQNVKKFSHPWPRLDRLLKNWVSHHCCPNWIQFLQNGVDFIALLDE